MAKPETVGINYGALRKECLEAVRQWPGCETVGGIQIVRDNTPSGFSVRVTLYGQADEKVANRANRLRRAREATAFSPDRMIRPHLSIV
jgi:hypothetical protein